jgi:hypothetical protein
MKNPFKKSVNLGLTKRQGLIQILELLYKSDADWASDRFSFQDVRKYRSLIERMRDEDVDKLLTRIRRICQPIKSPQ